MNTPSFEQEAEEFRQLHTRLREEIGKAIVGQREIIDGVLTCVFAGGHALLEGVPGLGKTYLVRTLSEVLDLPFKRIQFTPDLMPADIIGTNVLATGDSGDRKLVFQPGPVFAQIVLADEINRATPKTQSALLEAMQEHSVTVGGTIHRLDEPFFVMGTQNPVEQEGTYPLPEAQLDRFFFKLLVESPKREEIAGILERTTTEKKPEINSVVDGREIARFQQLVREVLIAPHVTDYAVRLVLATHPSSEFAPVTVGRFVRLGSSPRGAQTLVLAAKVRALVEGRINVSYDDVRAGAVAALQHRLLLNFEAHAEGVVADQVVHEVIEGTPEKASD
ncbi:Holliday junction ATP-dependent DNA helicase RuvB [Planctomycetes bacterium Pan216]|uniref:Holliday junction ATP-dependent DNA helicase RuvB n=1 Tax=Kolteria novifilia TaxID=2527975 RepID=A0A518BCT6_9BACT|nr:Holliday junction ATP-dependent DNA helicase RuvB [Planctomycetes bacterium Pan216]